MQIAELIDGGFYQKRYKSIYRDGTENIATMVAKRLHEMAFKHLAEKHEI